MYRGRGRDPAPLPILSRLGRGRDPDPWAPGLANPHQRRGWDPAPWAPGLGFSKENEASGGGGVAWGLLRPLVSGAFYGPIVCDPLIFTAVLKGAAEAAAGRGSPPPPWAGVVCLCVDMC